jgi:chromate reductase, NAD(P)H dehydrogenase (quinone)
MAKRNIFAIVGSASSDSVNLKIVEKMAALTSGEFNWTIFSQLKTMPHFDPELSATNPPTQIVEFRRSIEEADGVVICTPEYVFSIPSGLKNVIEWCVATTVFANKPTTLITASANGQKGHEELQRIMKTLLAASADETALLIKGAKGSVNQQGVLTDEATMAALTNLLDHFRKAMTK